MLGGGRRRRSTALLLKNHILSNIKKVLSIAALCRTCHGGRVRHRYRAADCRAPQEMSSGEDAVKSTDVILLLAGAEMCLRNLQWNHVTSPS